MCDSKVLKAWILVDKPRMADSVLECGGLDAWIQNRGPEQEIPAVTCVRLIAQETSILAPWIVRYSTDIGK